MVFVFELGKGLLKTTQRLLEYIQSYYGIRTKHSMDWECSIQCCEDRRTAVIHFCIVHLANLKGTWHLIGSSDQSNFLWTNWSLGCLVRILNCWTGDFMPLGYARAQKLLMCQRSDDDDIKTFLNLDTLPSRLPATDTFLLRHCQPKSNVNLENAAEDVAKCNFFQPNHGQ